MCTTKQALEKKEKKKTNLQEWEMRRSWACNAHMDIQCMKRECMYACTDYDLLIMYKCVKFCEINIHSFIHSFEIALRWMWQDLTDDKSTLVEVMAWCRQATSHYLNQCWPRSMLPYGVTRPQWVNYHMQSGHKFPYVIMAQASWCAKFWQDFHKNTKTWHV